MTDIHALLARVAELDRAATEGPWTWASRETVDGDSWAVFDTADHAVASNNDGWTRDAELTAEFRTVAPTMARALQAVLKVHARATMESVPQTCYMRECEHEEDEACPVGQVECCGTCLNDNEFHDPVPWPCPTVEAITRALEVEG